MGKMCSLSQCLHVVVSLFTSELSVNGSPTTLRLLWDDSRKTRVATCTSCNRTTTGLQIPCVHVIALPEIVPFLADSFFLLQLFSHWSSCSYTRSSHSMFN